MQNASETHYPWLWDSEMDNRTFEAVLRGDTAVPPHDVRWAIVRLVEYAPFSEIKRLLPVQRFLDLWPEIAVRVRSRTRREGMDFYYRWLLERHDKPCPSVGSKNGCLREAIRYNNNMAMLKEIEEQALSLSEADRATLAARLLDSLPAVLSEDDDGLAEALRRDAELEQSPSSAITWDELRRSVKP